VSASARTIDPDHQVLERNCVSPTPIVSERRGEVEVPGDEEVPSHEEVQRLESRTGASLELARDGVSERLRVRDGGGRLIFEHDPESGKTTLSVAGDLSLHAGGQLDLVAVRGVRLMSPGPVTLESQTLLRAGVTGPRFAGLRALPGKLVLTGRRLEAAAERANMAFERLEARGKQWEAAAEQVKLTASRLETVADRVLRHAKNVYDRVDELKQERLGRLRTLVRDAIDLRGKAATLVTEGEIRIDGERIHLG
jgi:hypothetical protein